MYYKYYVLMYYNNILPKKKGFNKKNFFII